MPYTMPVPTRAQWQTLRNSNKVPKGAAKVSIGDDIEKVHSTFSIDTIDANMKATQKLITDLNSYMTATHAKYPNFQNVVKNQVQKKAENHLRFLEDIVKAKTEYYPRYSEAVQTFKSVRDGNGATPKQLAAKLQRVKGCVDAFALIDATWEAKRPQVQSMFQICDSVATLSDTNKQSLETLFQQLKP